MDCQLCGMAKATHSGFMDGAGDVETCWDCAGELDATPGMNGQMVSVMDEE